jgi:formate dehydrogenase iron-sulfur subunit
MYALLFDANLCIGCGACRDACKQENGLPESDGAVLSATDYTIVEDHDGTWLRRLCMHCLEPGCASACPVGALHKTEAGPVVYDFDKCIGCRYCMVACPFGIPRYEWTSMTPRVRKCQFCPQRVSHGKPSACAEACPTGATSFGKRADMIAEAWRRIAAEPARYAQRVYGTHEAGGTSTLVIGPPEILAAFDPRVPRESLPKNNRVILSQIPTAVAVAGSGLLGVNWIIRRRMALAHEEEASGIEVESPEALVAGSRTRRPAVPMRDRRPGTAGKSDSEGGAS